MMQFQNKAMAYGPSITTQSPLLSAEVGFPYLAFLAGTGGALPYSYGIVSGALAAGLSLSTSGVISGIPLSAQTDNIGVQITDASGAKSSIVVLGLTVISQLTITTTSPLPAGTQSTAYSTSIVATGGAGSNVWSIVSQTGTNAYSINSSTGVLTSSAANAETDSVVIQVKDALNNATQKTFSVTINALTQAATPTFSPPAGTYSSTQSVTLSCATPSPSMFYTLDGSTPTTSSTPYVSAISVSSSETIKAIAIAPGFSQSNVGSAAYTISGGTVQAGLIQFVPGDFMNSIQGEVTTATPNLIAEIQTLGANHANIRGFRTVFAWFDLENQTATSNGAFAAAGLTGAPLQAVINTQFPGFNNKVAAAFYTLQTIVPGMMLGPYINHQNLGTYNNNGITLTNWLNSGFNIVPAWIGNGGVVDSGSAGTLKIPDFYGASTTSLHSGPIDKIYSGSAYYGFCFTAYNSGSNAFAYAIPHMYNPAVVQAMVQVPQALALWTLPAATVAYNVTVANTAGQIVTSGGHAYLCIAPTVANTPAEAPPNASFWLDITAAVSAYAGKTLQQTGLCPVIGSNLEYSFNMCSNASAGGTNNIAGCAYQNPPTAVNATQASAATMIAGYKQLLKSWAAAWPLTPVDICFSFGADVLTGGESKQTMGQYLNNLVTGGNSDALCTIPNLIFGNANFYGLDFFGGTGSAGTGSIVYSATGPEQAYLGIDPPTSKPTPLPAPTSAKSLLGKMGCGTQHQLEDYWDNRPSGVSSSSAAAVNALIATSAALGACWRFWNISTSDETSPWAFLNGFWPNILYPAIQANATKWVTLRPTNLMNVGVTINSVAVASSSSLTVSWALFTLDALETGLSGTLYRNGVAIQTGLNVASGGASSFTDTGLSTATSYSYTMALANSYGTGPQGPAVVGQIAGNVINCPTFTSSNTSNMFFVSSGGTGISGGVLTLVPTTVHVIGAVWWKTPLNLTSFSTTYTLQFTPAAAPAPTTPATCTMGFVVQNSTTTTNPDYSVPFVAQGDANVGGYGSYNPATVGPPNSQYPIGNSVAVKYDISGPSAQMAFPAGGNHNSTGLYIWGGPYNCMSSANDLNPYSINLNTAHEFLCTLVYDGAVYSMVIQDTTTNTQARYEWPMTNLTSILTASTGYVGFTAGTVAGGTTVGVKLYNWAFNTGYNTRLASPTFSVAAGSYTSTQTVGLSGPVGASIYYTTNGLLPTSSSTLYTAPITVSSSQIITAVSIEAGFTDSLSAQANYQIAVSATPTINFPSGFAANDGMLLTGHSVLNGTAIQLTDTSVIGNTGETAAAWYGAPVNISSFTTNFQLQFTSASGNGMTFCLQNYGQYSPPYAIGGTFGSPAAPPVGGAYVSGGPTAFGSWGQALGYGPGTGGTGNGNTGGIVSSAAVSFNLTNNGVGVYTGGILPSGSDTTVTGITLTSGHPINVSLSYSGTTLSMTLTDTVTLATFSHSWTINIPTAVGASTAYAGFTAGTNVLAQANQFVNKWTM